MKVKYRIFYCGKMYFWGIGDLNDDGSSCVFPSGALVEEEQMMFTGIMDQFNEEIYCGDIVEVEGYGTAFVFWDDQVAGFRIKAIQEKTFKQTIGFEETESGELFVIGNIHENSDLLKIKG